MESEVLIGAIDKKPGEEVRVFLGQFSGPRVDVRMYFKASDGEYHATKKGVMLRVDQLPQLIDLLQAAYARAVEDGMLQQ